MWIVPGADHRIALISDIHGSEIALSAVLRSIRARGVDEIVCLGDTATLGVAPAAVLDTLQGLGCRCVMGNHDEYLLDRELTDAHNSCMRVLVDAIDWCRDAVRSDQLEFVSGFEAGFELPLGAHHALKLFHGSPRSNIADLLAETPAQEFDAQLGPDRAAVMAGGHTHLQMLRQHKGTLVVNPGSVGAPFREHFNGKAPEILDHAEYACVEARGRDVNVTLHRVGLDRAALFRAARASANPMGDTLAACYR